MLHIIMVYLNNTLQLHVFFSSYCPSTMDNPNFIVCSAHLKLQEKMARPMDNYIIKQKKRLEFNLAFSIDFQPKPIFSFSTSP